MERTERPTESRLEELRSQGIIAYSEVATQLAGAAGFFVVLMLVGKDASGLMNLSTSGDWDAIGYQMVRLTLFPALGYGVTALLFGVIQTRFYIMPSLFSWNAVNLTPFDDLKGWGIVRRAASELIFLLLGISLGVGSMYLLTREVLVVLNYDKLLFDQWFERFCEGVLPWVVGGICFAAALSWMMSRARFFRQHRMTRNEIEREARER